MIHTRKFSSFWYEKKFLFCFTFPKKMLFCHSAFVPGAFSCHNPRSLRSTNNCLYSQPQIWSRNLSITTMLIEIHRSRVLTLAVISKAPFNDLKLSQPHYLLPFMQKMRINDSPLWRKFQEVYEQQQQQLRIDWWTLIINLLICGNSLFLLPTHFAITLWTSLLHNRLKNWITEYVYQLPICHRLSRCCWDLPPFFHIQFNSQFQNKTLSWGYLKKLNMLHRCKQYSILTFIGPILYLIPKMMAIKASPESTFQNYCLSNYLEKRHGLLFAN